MKLTARLLRPKILATALITALLPTLLPAATFVWDGGGTNDSFGTAANWNPNSAPSSIAADNVLIFGGTVRLTPAQDAGGSFRTQSLQFNSTAGAFTISGSQINLRSSTLTPTIVQSSASDQIISAPLLFTDNVTLSGTGTGKLSLTGSVSGAGMLTKQSTGTLQFNGAVSIPNITVSTGSVNFAPGSSSTAALIAVNAGADFTLAGGTVNTGVGAFFQVGNSAGTAATATLLSGSLTSTESDIGNVSGATGTVTHSGGTHAIAGALYLGVVAN